MTAGARPPIRSTRSSAASSNPSSAFRNAIQCSNRELLGPGPKRRRKVWITFWIADRIRARTSWAKRCAGSGPGMRSPAGRAGKKSRSLSRTSSERDGSAAAQARASSPFPKVRWRDGCGVSLATPATLSWQRPSQHRRHAPFLAKAQPIPQPRRDGSARQSLQISPTRALSPVRCGDVLHHPDESWAHPAGGRTICGQST